MIYNFENMEEIIKTDGKSIDKYQGILHSQILHKIIPFKVDGKEQTITIGTALAKQRQGSKVVPSNLLPREKIVPKTETLTEEPTKVENVSLNNDQNSTKETTPDLTGELEKENNESSEKIDANPIGDGEKQTTEVTKKASTQPSQFKKQK